MANNLGRALVVDDESQIRNLTMRMLDREGFACSAASDGAEASRMLAVENYDVVVTDLRMPNRHGHALAVEILAMPKRPVLVVLTGMLRAALAAGSNRPRRRLRRIQAGGLQSFRGEGQGVGAAKQNAACVEPVVRGRAPRPCEEIQDPSGGDCDVSPPGMEIVTKKLQELSRVLPISRTALEVFEMTASDSADVKSIAAAIACDPALSVETLRLANSAFYCPTGQAVVGLDEAVLRIGQKRVGELALAANALESMTANVLPWMNADIAWRRSVAAGIAIDRLLAKLSGSGASDGMFLGAIAHSLGRIALGTLFPQHYGRMIRVCREKLETLDEQERHVFPFDQGTAMAMLLEMWRLPAAVTEPLKHIDSTYLEVGALSEGLRTKVELLKVAILIARIAVGRWETWDKIEIPPAPTMRRLGLVSAADVIENTRVEVAQTIASHSPRTARSYAAGKSRNPADPHRRLSYSNLSPEPFDFVASLLPALGIELIHGDADESDSNLGEVVNCLWTPAYRLAARPHPRSDTRTLILCDAEASETHRRFGSMITFPASYGSLAAACDNLFRRS